MQSAIEIAESIARDTSCAQGEFKSRVLAIISHLDGQYGADAGRLIIKDRVPWKVMTRNGKVWYETTTPGEDAIEIEKLQTEIGRLRSVIRSLPQGAADEEINRVLENR